MSRWCEDVTGRTRKPWRQGFKKRQLGYQALKNAYRRLKNEKATGLNVFLEELKED
jgi:methionine salvage enolase-phosphatase E1